jgi:hypothetical protein
LEAKGKSRKKSAVIILMTRLNGKKKVRILFFPKIKKIQEIPVLRSKIKGN